MSRRSNGQATIDVVFLLALVATLMGALAVALPRGDGPATVVAAIRHALAPHPPHGDRWALASPTWGPVLRRYAPRLVLERDEYGADAAVPVDFALCRVPRCAALGTGRPVVFAHLIRRPHVAYLAYWFYYPDSLTAHLPVAALRGYHHDDWEGVIVRLDGHGAAARATAHTGLQGARPWWSRDPGWRPIGPHPTVYRASGSHANGFGPVDLDLAGDAWNGTLGTVVGWAIEPADEAPHQRRRFDPEASPPWMKRLWSDPEATSTSASGSRGAAADAAALLAAALGRPFEPPPPSRRSRRRGRRTGSVRRDRDPGKA
jgi:hypothetical protein